MMDPAEERIIDLVDVVCEGKPLAPPVQETPVKQVAVPELTPEWEAKIAALVREEVDRLIRTSVAENVEQWAREVLAREAEKAITREIESLKSAQA
jgi:hypothetical protein